MDDPADAPRPRDEAIEELDGLLEDREAWPAIDPDKLRHLLFYQCLSYGIHPDDRAIPTLVGLHRVAVERLHAGVRRDIVARLAGAVERLHRQHALRDEAGFTNALLPFLLEDPDPSVVCAAASELALLLPAENGDPLAGPRYVRSLLDDANGDDPRAGIVAGLLQLGDTRLAPLVRGAWSLLADEGRETLALLIQAFHGVHVLTVEFLLSWLEDEAREPLGRSFGIVAATLARAGRHAGDHGISDIRRTFPITDAPEDEPFVVTRAWSLTEFAPTVEERLMRVAGVERPAVLMPHVLNYWGFGDSAYHLAAAAASDAVRASLAGPEGACDPVRLELPPDWPEDAEKETLLEWGRLDPHGPTISTLRLTPAGGASCLVHTVYHPRATTSHVVAVLPGSPDRARVAGAVREVMRRNGDAGAWLPRELPDYVRLPAGSCLGRDDVASAIEAARTSARAAGGEDADLRPHSGYAEWLRAAAAPEHVAAVRREIPIAWQRAREAAGQEGSRRE